MVGQLEKEAEEDEDVYEKMVCWCEVNDKEKTQSIGEAETRIKELEAAIEEHSAESARLNTEINNLNKEVGRNTEALNAATALRQKQLDAFNQEEKDSLVSINSLKGALQVLKKQNA